MQAVSRTMRVYFVNLSAICIIIWLCSACGSDVSAPLTEEEQWFKQKTLDSLVKVEGGTFHMGDVGYIDENGEKQNFTPSKNDSPNRHVTLTDYYIQKFEVSFRELDVYTNAKGLPLINEKRRNRKHMQPDYAAKGMTWFEARDYCQWTGEFIGLPMALASEAQWEYAARSRGLAVAYATDDGTYDRGRNIRDATKNQRQMLPGTWPPNPLGLYDMTGNVDEWTLDWFIVGYPFDDETNPTGPDQTTVEKYNLRDKVTRGGGVIGGASQMQLYLRMQTDPNNDGAGIGIRCVANHPGPIDHLR